MDLVSFPTQPTKSRDDALRQSTRQTIAMIRVLEVVQMFLWHVADV